MILEEAIAEFNELHKELLGPNEVIYLRRLEHETFDRVKRKFVNGNYTFEGKTLPDWLGYPTTKRELSCVIHVDGVLLVVNHDNHSQTHLAVIHPQGYFMEGSKFGYKEYKRVKRALIMYLMSKDELILEGLHNKIVTDYNHETGKHTATEFPRPFAPDFPLKMQFRYNMLTTRWVTKPARNAISIGMI